MNQSIQIDIEKKLKDFFSPVILSVANESHMHGVPKGSETHFKIQIVSDVFSGKKLLERHRMVNQLLVEEIAKIRASALYTFTPEEWERDKNETFSSPVCVGGSKTSA